MVDVSAATFEQQILVESTKRPVLVDFWAEWCGPCRVLGPVLEKLEKDYAGGFALAKINTEAEQAIAQQFQISSIPACKLFKDGKVVDEFVGALPEAQIKQFLDRHIVSHAEQEIFDLMAGHDYEGAYAALQEGDLSGPRIDEVTWLISLYFLTQKKTDSAKEALERISPHGSKQSQGRTALLNFLNSDADANSQQQIVLVFDEEQRAEAFDFFLKNVENSADKAREKAKAELFAAFAILGDTDPMVIEYRKKLARILF